MEPKATNEITVGNESGTESTSATETATDNETQSKPIGDNKPSEKTYTEAEYKGLQAVIAKRDKTILDLTNEKQELINKLAETEANHGSAVTEKTSLNEKLARATEEKTDLEKKVAALEKDRERQRIVMKDFVELAPIMEFIPDTESEEEFRAKAKELQESLNKYASDKTKQTLSGASMPVSGNEDSSTLSGDEVDRLYREAMKLAGIPGKEAEYEKSYSRYLELSGRAT